MQVKYRLNAGKYKEKYKHPNNMAASQMLEPRRGCYNDRQ